MRKLGERQGKRSGESEVYFDQCGRRMIKIKDPYAKSPMKPGVMPDDAILEHVVHNLIFPETKYPFLGISAVMDEVRIVLEQNFVPSIFQASRQQIENSLRSKSLYPDGPYKFSNKYVNITDVMGDNVLIGENGKVYFIDPIIDFNRSEDEIIANC